MAKPAKKRKRSRKRRRARAPLLLTLLCLVLASAAIITAMTLFFKIGDIEVRGDSRYQSDAIIAASGLKTGDNLILFDKFGAIRSIFAACPYLEQIQIRRHLPDKLVITVTDCTPGAVILTEDGSWIMDKYGKLLERVDDTAAVGVTQIKGVALTQPIVGKSAVFSQEDIKKPLFLLLNTAREDDILKNIGVMDFSTPYAIQFTYGGRFTVKIGSTEELSKKLRYLRLIVEEKLGANVTGVIDVSDTRTARFVPN